MNQTKTIKCKRCSGTVFYNSVEGKVCFGCNGNGENTRYTDKMFQAIGGSGLFFGYTGEVATYGSNKGKVNKAILRAASQKEAEARHIGTLTEITEAQARKFFERYGRSTEVMA